MKRIVFVTNIAVTHQIGIWDEFVKNEEVDFMYLVTSELSAERKKMKYQNINRKYIKKSKDYSMAELKKLVSNSDYLIFGCTDDKRIYSCFKYAKTILFISEHLYKTNSLLERINIKKFSCLINVLLTNQKCYLLSNSFYVQKDFVRARIPIELSYKFGYYPPLDPIPLDEIHQKNKYEIVWCGRLLEWKNPLLAIKSLQYLLAFNQNYHLTMIGEGPEYKNLFIYCKQNNLLNNITFVRFIENCEVINYFKKSSLFLFTSNHSEGWGVVLNEAMSQGCFCITSVEAGSTNFLIMNKENGLKYSSYADLRNMLFEYENMSQNDIEKIQTNAVLSIQNYWNNTNAANQLYNFIISEDNFIPPVYGPMSLDE